MADPVGGAASGKEMPGGVAEQRRNAQTRRLPPREAAEQLQANLEHLSRLIDDSSAKLDHASHRQEADDRSWIARTIIWVFVAVIAAGLGLEAANGAITGKWDEATRQSTDLIRSTVLPIVTLVLGYYFGRSGKG